MATQPVIIDIGAAGKGYLVDLIADLLHKNNVDSFCVDAGGDMAYRSAADQPLRVGLEHPNFPSQVIGIAPITNQSLCGSSGNRRQWGDFHHIINPHTLRSPRDIIATWVIAPSTMVADALATCLFFTSPDILLEHYEFEYVIIHSDLAAQTSPGFSGEIFTK